MLLVYCENCGFRISQELLERGQAVLIDENKYLCAKCQPQAAPAPETTDRKTPGLPPKPPSASTKIPPKTPTRGVQTFNSTASTAQIPAAVHAPNKPASSSTSRNTGAIKKPVEKKPIPVPVMAGAGAAVALVLVFVLFSGKKQENTPVAATTPDANASPKNEPTRKDVSAESKASVAESTTIGSAPSPTTSGPAVVADKSAEKKMQDRSMPSWMQGVDVRSDSGPRRPKEDTQRDEGNETIFFDDALPPKADENGTGNVRWISWKWVPKPGPVFSRNFSHTVSSDPTDKIHQHFFEQANPPLRITSEDVLFAYVYIDPAAPPKTLMMQWNDGSWEHRAFWGEEKIEFGVSGTASRMPMGPLPAAGQWMRLEVPAAKVGLTQPVIEISGCSFDHFGGRVYWDKVGVLRKKAAPPAPAPVVSAGPIGQSGNLPIDGMVTLGKVPSKQLDGGREFENFAGKKLSSRAIWAKPTPLSTFSTAFNAPGDKYGAGVLIITSLKHERAPCRIALEVNGKIVFDGVDPATKQEWGDFRFAVPDGTLRSGTNTVRILNMEERGQIGASPWYMVNAVELYATPTK